VDEWALRIREICRTATLDLSYRIGGLAKTIVA